MSKSSPFWLTALGLFATSPATAAPASTDSTVSPVTIRNGWNADLFTYQRPARLAVEETTPSLTHADWRGRPAQMAAVESEISTTASASPRVIEGMNVVRLRFKDVDGDIVPVLLCTPKDKPGPYKVAVAVHGLTSHKAQVAAQVAPELTKRGFAVLCPDLPRHGERPGDPHSLINHGDIMQAFNLGRRAVNDVRQTIDLAEARPELDTSAGVYLVGYSLGSWINSVTGAADARVKGMVLLAGGALDIPAVALLLPKVAATDPRLALAHFAGRPVLMLNGRRDLTVPPDWAKRLYAAAAEPKEQVWYDAGHLLTADAYKHAADWLANLAQPQKKLTQR